VATPPRAQPSRDSSAQSTPTKAQPPSVASPVLTPSKGRQIPPRLALGQFSHGTAHTNLNSADGTDFLRSWKLPGPMKVVDKLKALLLGEMAGAEWEVLEQEEWGVNEAGLDEDAVLVGPRKGKDHVRLAAQSVMSV